MPGRHEARDIPLSHRDLFVQQTLPQGVGE